MAFIGIRIGGIGVLESKQYELIAQLGVRTFLILLIGTRLHDIAGRLFLYHIRIIHLDSGSLRNAPGVIPNCLPNRRVNDGSD